MELWMFEIITASSYWLLTILWITILFHYRQAYAQAKLQGGITLILLAVLFIDAFRTLFESLYFGFYFNSLYGFLPEYFKQVLGRPEFLIIPKLVNILAGLLVMALLLRRWIPKEFKRQEFLYQNLKENEDFLSQVYASATDGLCILDANSHYILQLNPAAAKMLGYTQEEMEGLSLSQFCLKPGTLTDKFIPELLKNGCAELEELQCRSRHNDIRFISINGSLLEFKNKTHLLLILRDITEHREAKTRYASLNRLYAVLSESNKVIVRHSNQQDLFNDICQLIIKQGQFRMAWIGLLVNQQVNPVASFGVTNDYVTKIKIRTDDSAYAQGPIGQAIITRKVCHVDDVATDKDFTPWREAALANGYHAVAALPMIKDNKVIGVVGIYSSEPFTFDDDMLDLLSDMGEDLSYALSHIANEEKRQRYAQRIDQLSQVVEQSANAVSLIDINGKIRYINSGFTSLTGYRSDDILGKPTSILSIDNQQLDKYAEIWKFLLSAREWKGELEHRNKQGETYWAKHVISPIKDTHGVITHYVDTAEDNSDLHHAQQKIQQLAFYDPLTELPNRRLLQDRLHQAMARARRENGFIALLYLDLDKFKTVNDTLGHNAGDELLKITAQKLNNNVREMDTVARLGGDEFTILLTDLSDFTVATHVAQKIIAELSTPVELENQQVIATTSIGITLFPQDGNTMEQLLQNADTAMYHAKAEGRNNFQFYTQEMNDQLQTQIQLQQQLREAIKNQEFELFYQPQLDIISHQVIGMEALIRWKHPEKGFVPPGVFIPQAEESGLITEIGNWVIQQAGIDMQKLIQAGYADLRIAINISAQQFQNSQQLIENIQKTLSVNNLQPGHIEVEVTESMLMEDIDTTIAVLHQLHKLGIQLAIDDFGTGYSSLNYLKRFPVDTLKVDQSFVQDVCSDQAAAAIATTIITLGHELGMTVLAEGVEEQDQQAFLHQQGCDQVQGYLFSRPVPFSELLEYLKNS